MIGSVSEEDSLLSAKQLASRIGVCVQTIFNWRRQEKLTGKQKLPKTLVLVPGKGGTIRWRLSDVKEWESGLR